MSALYFQYLYLEGNHLATLPEDFFQLFPSLKWLDLRHNKLVIIPSIYLRSHENLRTILLEGNQLRTLPLELGNTLHLCKMLPTVLWHCRSGDLKGIQPARSPTPATVA